MTTDGRKIDGRSTHLKAIGCIVVDRPDSIACKEGSGSFKSNRSSHRRPAHQYGPRDGRCQYQLGPLHKSFREGVESREGVGR
jgi:hypothetical protein